MLKSAMMIERKQKYEISLKWLLHATTTANKHEHTAVKRSTIIFFFFLPFIAHYAQSQLLPVLALI